MPVVVYPYDPEWKQWFLELREPIWELLGDLVVDVVHVGSTSIVGMSAKPVIDIDIVVDDWACFTEVVERLGVLDYTHIGDLGIKEREAFKESIPFLHPHNLYVTHVGSIAYRNHTLLKKHLTENPVDFDRYNDLKLNLAETMDDVDSYCRAKTQLILEFLEKEGVTGEELDIIRRENLG